MASHKYTFHERKQLECEKCKKSFKENAFLQRHLEQHDLKEQGLKFSCEKCKRTYHTRSSFNGHLIVYHNGSIIKPCMVLDEPTSQNCNVKQPDIKKNLDSEKQDQGAFAESTDDNKSQRRGSSRVMKGQWIVKLERIDVSECGK